MTVYNALFNECYSELILWFGKDTFCQINLCTLLAYLEQIDYTGRITLNYIDDETFETLEENINIELGSYVESYKKILIEKELPDNTGVLLPDAVELYFDYLSDNGVLAELIYNNRDREESDIICIILENSKLYGLSDIQASKLIKKYKDRV